MKFPSIFPWSARSGASTGGVTFLAFVFLSAGLTLAMASDHPGQNHNFVRRSPNPNPFKTTDQIATTSSSPQEAPTGFDGATNNLVDSLTHQSDQMVFEEVEDPSKGLGPVYNAESCSSCHRSPVVGATSQITEVRAGQLDRSGQFTNSNVTIADGTAVIANRSLINDRAICPSGAFPSGEVQEHVPDSANVRALRASLNLLGDGFVEAIADVTIQQIAANQCKTSGGQICGQVISVPVLEAPGQSRVARFGWKNHHSSVLSFSADAYLNEMGVTNPLLPQDITSVCKTTTDPEDQVDDDGLADIDHFARFIRATKAPARDETLAATIDAQLGAEVFSRIGCGTCHVSSITTAPAGSVINGGSFTVPDALGNKIIHPYSDFLLHNVGTGDGIVELGGPQTAMKLRTPPLWGDRLHGRFMHDGLSLTFTDAINRHAGEASGVIRNFHNLTSQDRARLIVFLNSL
jgi:CxxC motif-containing protein (DUF1111 family)